MFRQRNTKIIATIGPASKDADIIKKMLLSGMDACRINFSHGNYKSLKLLFDAIKKAADEIGKIPAIIQDLQGPRVRVGEIAPIELRAKDTAFFPMSPKTAAKFINPGQKILIEDGKMECTVLKRTGATIHCEIVRGGVLMPNKGLNFPGASIEMPPITKKDREDLEFGLKMGTDFVAMSFVKTADDIERLRKKIIGSFKKFSGAKKFATPPGIIAKIETAEGVKNIKSIAKAADAVMIARGDLALDVSFYNLPVIQKEIIEACRKIGKPVIVATQMLESMISTQMPTRAEISDIGHAVFDGADAVMLSGETANGKFPVEAVDMIDKIIGEAEKSKYDDVSLKSSGASEDDIGYKARKKAESSKAKSIIVADDIEAVSRISRIRPPVPIYIHATERPELLRQFNIFWGVFPNPKEEYLERPIVYVEEGSVRVES